MLLSGIHGFSNRYNPDSSFELQRERRQLFVALCLGVRTKVIKAHGKQVLTYLKLTGMKLVYLLNFGEAVMKDGIHRIINGTIE